LFLLIPLGIFVGSVVTTAILISRKFVYLKKLSPDIIDNAVPGQENFWQEMFPGLADKIKIEKLREYRINFLAEFEKLLRRFRLVSLKIDSATNNLINKIRQSVTRHENSISISSEVINQEAIVKSATPVVQEKDWKEEEHRIIIEIAKNPKDHRLYKRLGNIYMRTGELVDAAESFKKVLELVPDDETTRVKLGRVLKKIEKMPM